MSPPAKKRRTDTSKKPPLHSGRWTPEEEAYVEEMISQFSAGQLPIGEGTTLRSFLAKMLNCNPKRVSKKYDGNPIYNGKAAYVRSRIPLPLAESNARQENLLELERKFREALMTMQRVESRLQTLTSHLMPPPTVATADPSTTETEVAAAAAPVSVACNTNKIKRTAESETPLLSSMVTGMDSDRATSSRSSSALSDQSSSSAVSSLTDDEEEKTRARASYKELEAKKPAATTSPEEQAASQVLLQLNASVKPLPRVAQAPAAAAAATATVSSETLAPKVNPSQVGVVNTSNNTSLASIMASNSASLQQKCNSSEGGELQALLQNLQGIRRQQQQQQHQATPNAVAPNPPAPSSLQSLLGVGSIASPLTQPHNAQQNLQSFMQTLQQHQQQQQRQPSINLQQLIAQSVAEQQPQQPTDLNSILQTLYQHPQQVAKQPEVNAQALFQATGQNTSVQPAGMQAGGNELLQQVLNQISSNNNNVAPQTSAPQHQMTDLSVLHSLVGQQQQQTSPPPQQQQQASAQVLQLMLNHQQLQQQQDGGSSVTNFMNQLVQSKAQQHKQQPGNNVQALLQSLTAAQNPQTQGGVKPLDSHQALSGAGASQQGSLQAFLMQLQTQNTTAQDPNVNQFQLPGI